MTISPVRQINASRQRSSCSLLASFLLTMLAENICDGTFGVFAQKCSRCRKQRHACVAVEPPLFPALLAVKQTREAYARSLRREDGEEEERQQAALDAGVALTSQLRVLDRNRNKVTGDRPTPRKARATAATAASNTNEALLLELQSLRRGVLALVEVGKSVSVFPPS
jgi:hypothetical protein